MKKIILPILATVSYVGLQSQTFYAGTNYSTFVNVNPDTVLNYGLPPVSETFDVNLFGSSAPDVQLTAEGISGTTGSQAYINVVSLDPNVFISFGRWDSLFDMTDSSWLVTKVARPLNYGEVINATQATWDNSTLFISDHSTTTGGNKNVSDFVGTEKYIGLKYDNGIYVAYGWIRVHNISEDTCYVKDFSSTDASVGISDIVQNSIRVFPNPVNDFFYLRNVGSFEISSLKLNDVFGREIRFTSENSGSDLKIVPEKNLGEGCYFLEYYSGKNICREKLIMVAE